GPARDDRRTRQRADDEHARRSANEPRHDRALDGRTPPRAWTDVVADDEQDVRNPFEPAPEQRRLGGERAPAGDDDDARTGTPQLAPDAGRDRIVVVDEA